MLTSVASSAESPVANLGGKEAAGHSATDELHGGRRAVVYSPNFVKSLITYPLGNKIKIRSFQRNDLTGEFNELEETYSVSYRIVAATFRTSHAFFFGGVTRRLGTDVIEAWNFPPLPGEYTTPYDPVLTPFGTPISVGAPPGAVLSSPFQATLGDRLAPQKLLIYQGDALGGVVDLAADPEGRFVLVIAGTPPSRRLFRLLVIEEDTPVVVYDDAIMQHADDIVVFNHLTLGRVYVLWLGSNPQGLVATVLIDADNDGNIDTREDHNVASYSAAGYTDGVWTTDFLTYP